MVGGTLQSDRGEILAGNGDGDGMVSVALAGLGAGEQATISYLVEVTGSLAAPIAAHVAFNALTVGQLLTA